MTTSCVSLSYPSILVGYMEPKEVWLSYCRCKTKRQCVISLRGTYYAEKYMLSSMCA